MPTIRLLNEQTANRIAAGEVIERPVAVVKELLENSLDAGATRILVEFRKGGKTLIRVEDNGSGMSPEDAMLSLERHATSKIKDTEDLFNIHSFGFRGEAIPSIASISRFTLRSRRMDDEAGSETLVNGGKVIHQKACGMPPGTTIEVSHLFNHVPARRKFLKTDQTEAGHIIQCVRLYALAQPKVTFILKEDGREVFRSPPQSDFIERVAEVWSRSVAQMLEPLEPVELDQIQLSGAIMTQGQGRSSRHDLQCFVNHRPVDSRTLSYAIMESYHTHMPKGRYPATFLFLHISPERIDVNVHPAKREIRFKDEGTVRQAVVRALLAVLNQQPILHDTGNKTATGTQANTDAAVDHTQNRAAKKTANHLLEKHFPANKPVAGSGQESPPLQTPPSEATSASPPKSERDSSAPAPSKMSDAQGTSNVPKSNTQHPRAPTNQATTLPHDIPKNASPSPSHSDLPKTSDSASSTDAEGPNSTSINSNRNSTAASNPFLTDYSNREWNYLGFLHKPRQFALFETPSGLLLMHCRAALERIHFERLCEIFTSEEVSTQQMLMPIPIELDAVTSAALESHLPFLHACGIEIEPFGRNFYRLTALPQWFEGQAVEAFIQDFLAGLREGDADLEFKKLNHRKLAYLAVTRALKMERIEHPETVKNMAESLMRTTQPLTCPRGRPTLIEWQHFELSNKFHLS